MKLPNIIKSERLELVDALRGFALLAIVLLHNLEHYNLYFIPDFYPEWLSVLDRGVWDTTWFVMAGKAFSAFSLLFGFSYFIQMDNQMKRGKPFAWRFAWRMVILILLSQLHALFYNGDILLIYAVMGFLLIPVSRLSSRAVLIIATILLLQPLEWWWIVSALMDPTYVPYENLWSVYGDICNEVMRNGNFLQTVESNIGDGQLFNNLWQIGAGRIFQIPALFMFGLLIGRAKYFVKSEQSIRFWTRVAIWSIFMLVVPLTLLKSYVPKLIENQYALESYGRITYSLWNFTYMALLVSCFSLLWYYKGNGYRFQRFIIPYGRMSLTNYITQSIIGCALYLNWGFGLYQYAGATFSFVIGLGIFVLQLWFSKWWLSRYQQGPLEWVWKKLTWIKFRSSSIK